MEKIDLGSIYYSKPEPDIFVIEAKEGIEIDQEKSSNNLITMENSIHGNYGLILDRKNDYSITPVEVYTELNNHERLKAIAIVCYRPTTEASINMEKKLYRGELEVFKTITDAINWMKNILKS